MAKRYPPKLKFQVVLELLKGDKTPSQVARAYNVHPNSAGLWKRTFLEEVQRYSPEMETLQNMSDTYQNLSICLVRKKWR